MVFNSRAAFFPSFTGMYHVLTPIWVCVGFIGLLQIVAQLPERAVYYVDVTTASDSSAGTDADVFIQIFGNKGNTSVRQLKRSGNLFQKGSTNSFLIIDAYVGHVTRVAIKRNSEGLWDSWKLERVVVKSLLPLHFKFDFNQWIPMDTWVFSYGGD